MITKLLVLLVVLNACYAPPVTKNKNEEDAKEADGLEDYVEYHRYIREVVNALESDPTFREKLENAKEEDIRSGKIAHELELVSHHVRTRLDEIKRSELDRLKDLFEKKKQLTENIRVEDPTHHHIDHANPHTFEIEDLKKLIAKTTEDLAEADKKRRDEFKEYELQKEFEKFDKLNHTVGEEHDKLEKEYKDNDEKHKKHNKLHTPGHKQQLEEVWEEQDHMQQDFNPKTFFMLHDLDSNGVWDQEEVKALFITELNKMYAAGAPEDDMRERVEEMERMRESVFKEMDTNKDGFIDFDEFLIQTKKSEYEKDNGWQGIDEQKPYSDEELEQYIRQHQQYPPQGGHPNDVYNNQIPPGGYHPQGAYQQGYPQAHLPPQGHMPPQGHNMPPGQIPQYQGNMPQHPGQHQPQAPINAQHVNNQVPPVPNPNFPNNQGGRRELNTNEIYPDNSQQQYHPNQQPQYQPNHQPQQYQPHQQPQHPNQQYQPPQQPNQQYQPNQQPHNPNQQVNQQHQDNNANKPAINSNQQHQDNNANKPAINSNQQQHINPNPPPKNTVSQEQINANQHAKPNVNVQSA